MKFVTTKCRQIRDGDNKTKLGSHGVLWQRRRGAIRPADRALVARLGQRKPTVRLRPLQMISVLLVLLRLLKLLGAVRVEIAATKRKQTPPLRTSINECIHERNRSRRHFFPMNASKKVFRSLIETEADTTSSLDGMDASITIP